MSVQQKFQTMMSQQSIYSIFKDISDKKSFIVLDPEYQRKVVWKIENKQKFIDSIMLGIVPNQIIFNFDSTSGFKTCIDGKQRLTTIKEYFNNEFPVVLGGRNVYFSKVAKKSDRLVRIMTNEEEIIFKSRLLNITEYRDLEYELQTEIFERLQNGMSVLPSEKIISLIKSSEIAKQYDTLCSSHENILGSKHIEVSRNKHIEFITRLAYLLEYDITEISRNSVEKFVKDESDKILKNSKMISALITNLFSDYLLNHEDVPRLHVNVLLVFAYSVYKKCEDISDLLEYSKNNARMENMRGILRIIKNECIFTKFSTDAFDENLRIIEKTIESSKKERSYHKNVSVSTDKDKFVE